jgi:tRNA-dihydrouridine synthase
MTQLVLAPLKGFTDAVFRSAFARHFDGFDAAVAPFVSTVRGGRVKASLLGGLLPEKNQNLPVIPQVLGNSAADFIPLARTLVDMGYGEINWNLGCPFPMVAKKGRGSGLLPQPDRIAAFLDRVVPAVGCCLSVKLRLGRRDPDEIFAVLEVLNRYPLSEIIIHPRTGTQMYAGAPDLDRFEKCADASAHPAVYNGDINTRDDFSRLAARFPRTRKWMIGRGALVDPFLPGTILQGKDDVSGRIKKFRRFHDDLVEGYRSRLSGEAHLLDRLKGFWKYFGLSFDNGRGVAKAVHRSKRMAVYTERVARFLESEAVWADPRPGLSIDERFR